jgi:DNA (cytosine-5)-methyltransferase 1
MATPSEFLEEEYNKAMSIVGSNETITSPLNADEKTNLNIILDCSETATGVITVFITSVVYKILNPQQDIRNHQDGMANGYSGRGFDARNITPFLKKHKFPAMASSGWLTRSLEQNVPYHLDYTGSIKQKGLKPAFLTLIDNIQNGANCNEYLSFIFQGLIIKRNQQKIDLAKPTALSINSILNLLNDHFNSKYKAEGASRLPVLAFYAIYKCLINEVKRFENKQLLPIESHTSADSRSGRIGDIDIVDENQRAFEAVEVKHGITITLQLVLDTYAKFQTTPVNRYYILSTAPQPNQEEWKKIQEEIQRIKNVHGCQLIVNGIMQSLKYYLRLLDNTFEFVDKYVDLLENDSALKFEHKEKWNKLINEMS